MLNLDIFDQILDIRPGTFHSYKFKSSVPVKAKYKDDIHISKVTTLSARTGIGYNKVCEPKGKVNLDSISIIKNKVKYNKNTSKYNLFLYPRKNGKRDTFYMITSPDFCGFVDNLDNYRDVVIDSYFNKTTPSIMTVSLNNILEIK